MDFLEKGDLRMQRRFGVETRQDRNTATRQNGDARTHAAILSARRACRRRV